MKLFYFLLAVFFSLVSAEKCVRQNRGGPAGRRQGGNPFIGAVQSPTRTNTATSSSSTPRSQVQPGQQGTTPGQQGTTPGQPGTPGSQSTTQGKFKCPAGFRNVVFNSGVNSQGNMEGRWQTLRSHGVSGWIGFTLDPVPAFGGSQYQLPIVMDSRNIQQGLSLIKSGNVPYLEIYNEPDFNWGAPPRTGAQSAQDALQFINAGTSTQFLSPGVAYPESSFYSEFFADPTVNAKINIISAHIYNQNPQTAIAKIQSLITAYPNKRIWITELSPASDISQGCQLDAQGMMNWMSTVIEFCVNSGKVDRVYWNAGEYGVLDQANPANCNPSLTDTSGAATPLLTHYQSLC